MDGNATQAMPGRLLITSVGALVLVLAGCSSSTPTIVTLKPTTETSASAERSSESPSSSSSADDVAVERLDGAPCVEVTGANLDLATAMKPDDARTAADTLERYSPPQSVQDAIEHFVDTGGAQFDDPDFTKYNDVIDEWVKQACP